MNLLSSLTPDQMMILGGIMVAGPVFFSQEKVQFWVKDKLTSISSFLKTINPFKPSPSPSPVPGPSPSPPIPPGPSPVPVEGIVITTPLEVHRVVTPLMAFFANNQDSIGVQLAGAVGQHMYDHAAEWMTAPKLVPPAAKELKTEAA